MVFDTGDAEQRWPYLLAEPQQVQARPSKVRQGTLDALTGTHITFRMCAGPLSKCYHDLSWLTVHSPQVLAKIKFLFAYVSIVPRVHTACLSSEQLQKHTVIPFCTKGIPPHGSSATTALIFFNIKQYCFI